MIPKAVLSQKTLAHAMPGALLPKYDRLRVSNGIVHLGVGNFHRGHQAVFTDDVLASGDMSWGITGISLRSPRIRQILKPQDCLYSVNFRDSETQLLRVIGSISDVLFAPHASDRVLEAMSSPDTKIVSLTITEKGYVWPEGEVAEWNPPRFCTQGASALLYIIEALFIRQARGIDPFTLLSCDNLAANGQTLKSAVLGLAGQKSARFASALAGKLACPSSMVDRIVPRSTGHDLLAASSRLGLNDQAAITAEPFGQWVIEDDFPTGRPDWSICDGVEFTASVEAHEKMKLRLLNGAHTFIALYGLLAGHRFVSDVMEDGEAVNALHRLWRNTAWTLGKRCDLTGYTRRLFSRFQNRSLRHRTSQIAMDTSQKLPQRVLEPLLELAENGNETRIHNAVVALWLEYLRRFDDVSDPLPGEWLQLARIGDVEGFVRTANVFPESYRGNTQLVGELVSLVHSLAETGPSRFICEVARS